MQFPGGARCDICRKISSVIFTLHVGRSSCMYDVFLLSKPLAVLVDIPCTVKETHTHRVMCVVKNLGARIVRPGFHFIACQVVRVDAQNDLYLNSVLDCKAFVERILEHSGRYLYSTVLWIWSYSSLLIFSCAAVKPLGSSIRVSSHYMSAVCTADVQVPEEPLVFCSPFWRNSVPYGSW